MRRKEPETQSKRKREMVNPSRIMASPSPVKSSAHLPSESIEQEIDEENTIIIKKSELVLFTKKFALEKIECEEVMEEVKRDNELLRERVRELEGEIQQGRMVGVGLGREKSEQSIHQSPPQQTMGTQPEEIDQLRQQLKESKVQLALQKDLRLKQTESLRQENQELMNTISEKNSKYLYKQREVLELQSQLNKAQHLYSKIKTEISQLRIAELEKARESLTEKSMVDQEERIRVLECDILRLRNLNELFRTQLKNQECEIKEKNMLIEELQSQILVLEQNVEHLASSTCLDKATQKRIQTLEMETQHLQNQLFLERANNRKMADLEFKYNELKEQLNTKNTTIVTLTSQLHGESTNTNKMLVGKCQELESHIQRLNRIIIEEKMHSQSQSGRDKEKHLRCKENSEELEQYKKKYSEMLESIRNLQSENEESQKFPPLEDLMNELEENPSRARLMENIISGLRSQNNELKSIIDNDTNSLNFDAQNQLRDIIYEMTRMKMEKEEENQSLRFKVDQLEHQLEKYKSTKEFQPDQSVRTFSKSVERAKRGRLNKLLRKIGDYSKEIVLPGDDASLEGDVYELVIGRLIGYIDSLQEGKSPCKLPSHAYSYSLQH